jgi:hypothetical protein
MQFSCCPPQRYLFHVLPNGHWAGFDATAMA